ncbi:hypothetical protein CLV93_103113 [Prolixibacter denitrificans]|uniref:Uncharacterized protein n=1 Tax=Prolixibacter denitrificans TaxID=1541063 RepID=A0A2P8CFE5_9BACT|nr:hypothetical protein CLV93_103113 [Prolixibacter denitrificans]
MILLIPAKYTIFNHDLKPMTMTRPTIKDQTIKSIAKISNSIITNRKLSVQLLPD